MDRFDQLFTDRQLVTLTTFSDLVAEARRWVLADALEAGMEPEAPRLADGGTGAEAYADAVATYLGLALDRSIDRGSTVCSWDSSPKMEALRNTFSRQALPMTWDYAEGNPFSQSSGNWMKNIDWVRKAIPSRKREPHPIAAVIQQDAAGETRLLDRAVVATDPPYYDNIGYADLSDFFYVWQRRTLRKFWPGLYRRVLVPKDEELVATRYRHGRQERRRAVFHGRYGPSASQYAPRRVWSEFPATLYYAFKQAEVAKEGLTSAGMGYVPSGNAFDAGYVDRRHVANQDGAARIEPYRSGSQRPCLLCRAGLPQAGG